MKHEQLPQTKVEKNQAVKHLPKIELAQFHDITSLGMATKEDLFIARNKQNKKVLLKHFGPDHPLFPVEIACYENLHLPEMAKPYGIIPGTDYLVLEFIDGLKELKPTHQDIDQLLNIVFKEFAKINPDFLPPRKFKVPHINERFQSIVEEGIINPAPKIITEYSKHENYIKEAGTHFSHGDYLLQNIKKRPNGKLAIFDFEIARRDHILFDPAALFVDLAFNDRARKYLLKELSQRPEYDDRIFKLLVWLRSTAQVFALKESRSQHLWPYKTGLRTLNNLEATKYNKVI